MTIAKQLKHDFKKGELKLHDSNGKLTYYEKSNGDWSKFEYTEDGKLIYFEDSDKYWCKYEYDSNGKLIYFEDSDKYWVKKEYNLNGREIYYENSDGNITDNRPKTSCSGKTVTIDGVEYELKEKNLKKNKADELL